MKKLIFSLAFITSFFLICFNQVGYSGSCLIHALPNGTFGPKFFRDSPYPKSWSSIDIQEYQYLGDWICQIKSLKSVQKQLSIKAFLIRNDAFAKKHPEELELWIWKGEQSLEVDDVASGWQAARNLMRFFPEPYSISLAGASVGALEDKGKLLLNELKDAGWATATYEAAKENYDKELQEYKAITTENERIIDRLEDDDIISRVDCDLKTRTVYLDKELWDQIGNDVQVKIGTSIINYCRESETRPTIREKEYNGQLLKIKKGLLKPSRYITQSEINRMMQNMHNATLDESQARNSPIRFNDNKTLKDFMIFDGKSFSLIK